MKIQIREFLEQDIDNKIKWINDSRNNEFLHYDLPLIKEKTLKWFKSRNTAKRFDATILYEGQPVGLIGLLNIDQNKENAEYYIVIGEHDYKGKGIALEASKQILYYGFHYLKLKTIFLTTEIENIKMQKLAQSMGMTKRGYFHNYSERAGKLRDVFYYSILLTEDTAKNSRIDYLFKDKNNNKLYIKREDLLDFSFGGNKVRKAQYFEKELISGNYDTVITYGSSVSNHCRVISDLAKKLSINCIIVSPLSNEKEESINRKLIKKSGAKVIECNIDKVSETIEEQISLEKAAGRKPYFIPGGGHNNLGTHAYFIVYNEIVRWEMEHNNKFDYLFLASGTGTTQAGLIVGQEIYEHKNRRIIGISIAREQIRGEKVVREAVLDYLKAYYPNNFKQNRTPIVNFITDFENREYGKFSDDIERRVSELYYKHGLALSKTYTGKAFVGMENYIEAQNIKDKNLLFIHTGGIPLFFDGK